MKTHSVFLLKYLIIVLVKKTLCGLPNILYVYIYIFITDTFFMYIWTNVSHKYIGIHFRYESI